MGILIISIDFELRWGVLDKVQSNLESYKENILSVHENLPWILKVFKERDIAATWATVGAIGCNDWDEFEQVKPKKLPSYQNNNMLYNNNYNKKIDPKGELYFAPNLIYEILKTKNQELGMHTFGHIYGTEPNVTYDEFKDDLITCKNFFLKKFKYLSESLVYPRNQIIYDKNLIEDNIIKTYRGNENVKYLSTENQRNKNFLNRVKILLDSINIYSSHSYYINSISNGNIPSSAMMRIYLPKVLRKIHLYKLKENIMKLDNNEIYHIWFHPHNIGTLQEKKDDFLSFFDDIGELISKRKLISRNMKQITQVLLTNNY